MTARVMTARRMLARRLRFLVGGPVLALAALATRAAELIDAAAVRLDGVRCPRRGFAVRPVPRSRRAQAVRALFTFGFDTSEIADLLARDEAEIAALLKIGRASLAPAEDRR